MISLRYIKITSLQSSGFPLDFTIKDRLPQFRTVSVRKIKKGHNLWSCPFYGGSLHIFKFPNLDKHYNLDISNFRFAILTSRPTAHLGRAAFAAFERFAAGKSSADCARRRVSERNRREAAALGAEMGGFASLSIKIPKGVAAFGRRNPKRKDILSDVLSFWWTIQGSDL